MTTRLARINQRVTEFVAQRRQEEEPGMLSRVGKAAAAVGTGAALVGGAGYLRGRLGMSSARAGALGPIKTAQYGFRKFGKDAQAGVSAVKSAFAPKAPSGPQKLLYGPGGPPLAKPTAAPTPGASAGMPATRTPEQAARARAAVEAIGPLPPENKTAVTDGAFGRTAPAPSPEGFKGNPWVGAGNSVPPAPAKVDPTAGPRPTAPGLARGTEVDRPTGESAASAYLAKRRPARGMLRKVGMGFTAQLTPAQLVTLNAKLNSVEFASPNEDYNRERAKAENRLDRRTHRTTSSVVGALAGAGAGLAGLKGAQRRYGKVDTLGKIALIGGGVSLGGLAGREIGSHIRDAKPRKPNDIDRMMVRQGIY